MSDQVGRTECRRVGEKVDDEKALKGSGDRSLQYANGVASSMHALSMACLYPPLGCCCVCLAYCVSCRLAFLQMGQNS